MSRPGIELGSGVGGEYSRKEPFEQLLDSFSEHLYMSLQQYLFR
jgi:hypothetical protein